jgi:LCP family protein required for cell wall assembly
MGGSMDENKVEYSHDFFDLPPLERKHHKKEKKQPMELWKVLLIILICLLFGIGSYFVGQVYGVDLIPPEEANPLPGDVVSGALDGKPETSPILNILVMGVDQRENEAARADVTALVALNLETKKINMISIPRDTRAAIAGTKQVRKINYAHAIGGPDKMVKSVENLLDVNIHYYVETNFEGFANCIDILGGVPIDVERRMYLPLEGIDLQAGQQTLNGKDSLSYVRWRGDALADIGRIDRQQKFLKILLDQSLRLTNVTKIPSLIGELQENLQTDMTGVQMIALAKEFIDLKSLQLNAVTLPGVPDEETYGASYWILNEEATKEIIKGIYDPVEVAEDKVVAENQQK